MGEIGFELDFHFCDSFFAFSLVVQTAMTSESNS